MIYLVDEEEMVRIEEDQTDDSALLVAVGPGAGNIISTKQADLLLRGLLNWKLECDLDRLLPIEREALRFARTILEEQKP